MVKRVQVKVTLEVPDDVPATQVRDHIEREVSAARGQFTGFNDWRADVHCLSAVLYRRLRTEVTSDA